MRCVDKNSNCKGELKREKTINEGGWWNVSGIQARVLLPVKQLARLHLSTGLPRHILLYNFVSFQQI